MRPFVIEFQCAGVKIRKARGRILVRTVCLAGAITSMAILGMPIWQTATGLVVVLASGLLPCLHLVGADEHGLIITNRLLRHRSIPWAHATSPYLKFAEQLGGHCEASLGVGSGYNARRVEMFALSGYFLNLTSVGMQWPLVVEALWSMNPDGRNQRFGERL